MFYFVLCMTSAANSFSGRVLRIRAARLGTAQSGLARLAGATPDSLRLDPTAAWEPCVLLGPRSGWYMPSP